MGLNSYQSPIGALSIESLYGEIIAIRFKPLDAKDVYPDDTTEFCIEQLKAYFNGDLKRFTVPIKLAVTEFQESVLEKVRQIEYGKIRSYLDIAEELGNKDHVRAVGMANSKNPIPILIPCHRVLGANGSMVGYLGGINAKKYLLQLEQRSTQLSLF